MKTLLHFPLIFLCLLSISLKAQTPRTISYQAVLTDTEGNALTNGNYNLDFSLYNDAFYGNELWTKMQLIELKKGVVNAVLGSEASLDLAFDKAYWLGIAVDSGEELSPRTALTASTYSLGGRATELSLADGSGAEIKDEDGNVVNEFNADCTSTQSDIARFENGIFLNTTDTSFYFVPFEDGMYILPEAEPQNVNRISDSKKTNQLRINLTNDKLYATSISSGDSELVGVNRQGASIGISDLIAGQFVYPLKWNNHAVSKKLIIQ